MLAKSRHLGGLLKQMRKEGGLTQAALARQAGVGLSAVRAVEKSQGRISTLSAMLQALDAELRGRQLAGGPVGPALAAARKRRRTSRRELARSLGVSRNTLTSIEAGRGLVSVLEAYAIAVGAGLHVAKVNEPRTFFNHAGNSSSYQAWQTPADLGAALSEAVGGFDIDPCAATRDPRKARVKAKILLTEADDGISVHWGANKKVYVNPPYNRALATWVRKCHLEAQLGTIVVALIPARTDSRYWHDYVAGHADVFMLKGRLKFGDGGNSAPFPSAVIAWGICPDLIRKLGTALKGAWHIPPARNIRL